MQVKTIREASKPVYIFSRFAGTIAIKRTTPEELTKSYPQSLLSIIYFAIFTIPAFVYYEDAFNFIKEADVSTTIFITSQVFLVTNFTSIITSAFLTHFYSKTIIVGVETLLDVDKNFDKINSPETLLRTNYSIWKRSIIALMGCLFCSLLPNVMALRINNSSAIITLNFSAAILINSSIKLQYYFASQILYFRFKTLSDLLSALVEWSKRCPSYPTSEKSFEKALSKIGKIHKDLVGLAKSVNLIYSVPLLFYVVLYLFSGLNSGYFVVYNFVTGNPLGPFVFLLYVNVSILLTYNLVEFFVLIRSTTSMCCEVSQNANRLKEVLHGIVISPHKIKSRNVVMATSLKLMNNRLDFMVCRLFHFDFQLLHSILATIVIYLVIILQFDLDALKKKSQNDFERRQ